MPSLLPILSYEVPVSAAQDGEVHKPETQLQSDEAVPPASNVADAAKLMWKAVYAIQMAMYNGLSSTVQLNAAARLLTQAEYADVASERSFIKQCGYVLCNNIIKPDKSRRGRYHISLREKKVFNLEETRLYCSSNCIASSKAFSSCLQEKREGIVEEAILEEIVACVRSLKLPSVGSIDEVSSNSLQIHERMNGELGGDTVSGQGIEIYVPRTGSSLPAPDEESPVRKGDHHQGIKSPKLKSAMKQSPRKHQRITWADEVNASVDDSSVDDSFSFGTELLLGKENEMPTPNSSSEAERLEIARALATALSDAASASSAGKVTSSEAALSTGLSIGTNLEELLTRTEVYENTPTEPAHLPKLKDTEEVETTDTPAAGSDLRNPWFDTAPKEFKAEVSMFGQIWMSLDSWVSAATLAHIYNKEGQLEQFQHLNGRVESRAFDDENVSSEEIRKTMASCISRVLPEVVQALAISIPISVLEQSVGRLLATMTFVSALPPLSSKDWRVICVLLLEALSARRSPRLEADLEKNRALLRKIVNAAGTKDSEYDAYKQLLRPLG